MKPVTIVFFFRSGAKTTIHKPNLTEAYNYVNHYVNYRVIDLVLIDGVKVHDHNWDYQSNIEAKRMPL